MTRKQRLELTWIGKDKREKLEPRVLIEDEAMSYAAPGPDGAPGLRENVLIKGDNLLALRALEAHFLGKVDCIFIDPPYNTGSAFAHYDDGVEHSLWLSLMRSRLERLRDLLKDDGSIWLTISDDEAHYLKVMLDEIFGRAAFVANIVWQKRTSRENRAAIGSAHDHILLYCKAGPEVWKNRRNRLADDGAYSNPDNDPRGPWRSIPFSAQGYRANQMYDIVTPTGKILSPPPGRCWGATKPVFDAYAAEGRVYFPKGGDGRPRIKQYQGEEAGLVPMTWWPAEFAGENQAGKREAMAFVPQDPFSTPKPEKLLQRVLEIATNPGDLVLDSFAGSGTTGAVAHKMGRRWIMVELHDHADTHIVPRLRKVIDGEDSGGVTEATGWQGGGGFRYYRLAPSLLQKDKWGQYVISREFKPEMLAEAVCKLMGFTYAPSQEHFWQHGHATERDFIYVTTQRLTVDSLKKLSHEVGEGRTLLVCCRAFEKHTPFENLTVKKIPQAVMDKCEWGRDDYSLNIQEAPPEPITEADLTDTDETEDAEAAE